MKITDLIAALERVKHVYGDIDVAVGERNGILCRRIDVNAEPEDSTQPVAGNQYIAIVQANSLLK